MSFPFSTKYIDNLKKIAGEDYPIFHKKGTHRPALSRRELLGQGLILGSSYIAVPSLIEILFEYLQWNRVYGANCAPPTASSKPAAFLQIEPSGGNLMAGDFVFGKQAAGSPLDPLQSYSAIGWNQDAHPSKRAPNTVLGGPMHAGSPLLAGLLAVMSKEAVAKAVVVGQANKTNDDNANNALGTTHLALKAVGSFGQLTQIAATGQSPSGGRHAVNPLGRDNGFSRALVASPNDLVNLVDPGILGAMAEKVAKAALAMSEQKLKTFAAKDVSAQVQELVACGYAGSSDLIKNFTADKLDPTKDTKLNAATTPMNGQAPSGLFAITNVTYNNAATNISATLSAATQLRTASIVKLLVDGNAAAAAIEMGGYDYHADGNVNTTNSKQMALGVTIGQALESAHRSGRSLFVAVVTDGAAGTKEGPAVNGQLTPSSDLGTSGSTLMFAIGETARPAMLHYQIGSFNDTGAVNPTDGIQADNPANASTVIAANFAQFAGKFDNLSKVGLPAQVLTEPNKYIAFKKA